MRNLILILGIAINNAGIYGQPEDSLKLDDCIRIAGYRSPLNDRKALSGEAMAFRLKNLGSGWLPAAGLNAQASYNSETVDFSDVMKGLPVSVPSLPLDQYKVWAELNQQLYDGGIIHARKSIEKASWEADILQADAELLVLKQQVNKVFFSLLITGKSAEILQVSLEELGERKKVIRSGVENGVLLAENLMSLDAEELKLRQGLLELTIAQQQLIRVLSVLMDTTISENTSVKQPVEPEIKDQPIERPEYLFFDKQKEGLQANQSLTAAADMPRFFAFTQGAYGRPGYNIVSSKFHTFYSAGLGMKWNFLNYGDSRRQKKVFEIQKELVDIKRKAFDDQLEIQLSAEIADQMKYTELLKKDEDIVKLRKAITASSFAKLKNGIITSSDYLSEMDNEMRAKLQFENHRILKLQAMYNYLLLQGNL